MGNSGRTIWENVIVIVLIGIIAIFLAPIVEKIIYEVRISSTTTKATNLAEEINVMYSKLSMTREVGFPFTVEFNKNGTYNLYENAKVIERNQFMGSMEKLPSSGSITIDENAVVSAYNIVYGDVICNMEKKSTMKCIRKPETAK